MDRILQLSKTMMRGEDVRDLQQKLTNLGFPCEEIDGIFGPESLQAVKSFQKHYKLIVDGIVGPQTWDSLNNSERILKLTKPMMSGEDVRDLQQKLSSLGHPCGLIDGIFGPETLQAVKSYQKFYKLSVDGMVGPETWDSLKSLTENVKNSDYPKEDIQIKTTEQQAGKVWREIGL